MSWKSWWRLLQRPEKVRELRDRLLRRLREPVHPRIELGGVIDLERPIGTERGINLRRDPGRGNRSMVIERIGRIVGRAHRADVERPQDAMGGQLIRAQPLVGRLPDRRRRLLVEQIVDAEVTLQLQVCPVIQRIAQAARHGRRPGEELLIGRRVAGAEALGHAVGAHGAPLVVIALEPDLEQVVEAPVAGHVGRRQVAVVVENRLPRRMLVIEPARRGAVEQEVVGDERHDSLV